MYKNRTRNRHFKVGANRTMTQLSQVFFSCFNKYDKLIKSQENKYSYNYFPYLENTASHPLIQQFCQSKTSLGAEWGCRTGRIPPRVRGAGAALMRKVIHVTPPTLDQERLSDVPLWGNGGNVVRKLSTLPAQPEHTEERKLTSIRQHISLEEKEKVIKECWLLCPPNHWPERFHYTHEMHVHTGVQRETLSATEIHSDEGIKINRQQKWIHDIRCHQFWVFLFKFFCIGECVRDGDASYHNMVRWKVNVSEREMRCNVMYWCFLQEIHDTSDSEAPESHVTRFLNVEKRGIEIFWCLFWSLNFCRKLIGETVLKGLRQD